MLEGVLDGVLARDTAPDRNSQFAPMIPGRGWGSGGLFLCLVVSAGLAAPDTRQADQFQRMIVARCLSRWAGRVGGPFLFLLEAAMANPKASVRPSDAELKGILASLSPEDRAKLEASLKSGSKSRRMSEEDILSEYPLVIPKAFDGQTLRWNEAAGKQEASVRCSIDGCKETRIAFTSDLFQVKTCMTHRKEQRKVARQARKAEADALIAKGKAALEAEKATS